MRDELLKIVVSDSNFKRICYKINLSYAEDIYQETCVELLTIPEHRLPEPKYLNFWFYRVAFNIMSKRGKLGSIVLKNEHELDLGGESEMSNERLMREAERFMLSLNEFENRVVLLYNELGDMKKVQRATGISYSALRAVREKLKLKAKEI
jgi:DNA-directed RNA polymerase specialized sigma24 family protein